MLGVAKVCFASLFFQLRLFFGFAVFAVWGGCSGGDGIARFAKGVARHAKGGRKARKERRGAVLGVAKVCLASLFLLFGGAVLGAGGCADVSSGPAALLPPAVGQAQRFSVPKLRASVGLREKLHFTTPRTRRDTGSLHGGGTEQPVRGSKRGVRTVASAESK